MKAYVAAAFSRRDEARLVAEILISLGVQVTSRWLYEEKPPEQDFSEFMSESALIDVEDILAANVLVRISDKELMNRNDLLPSGLVSGARMAGTMLAWREKKHVVIMGGRQMAFDYLPGIRVVDDEVGLIDYIKQGLDCEMWDAIVGNVGCC